jgi:hypothetical protein
VRQALQQFRKRYLAAAFDAWRCWYQRKAYLAAVFAQLQGKGHQQVRQPQLGQRPQNLLPTP